MTETGITAYGAYVPKRRLKREAVVAANAWMNPGLRGLTKGTRAMCNWDEDALTMGVEAARDCLGPYLADGANENRTGLETLIFASTTAPFADRHNAGVMLEALNLDENTASQDVGGTQRAATSALLNALKGLSGNTLLIAADHRKTKPGSTHELHYGDGAAALTLGTENVIARFLGGHALTRDLVDHYRSANAEFDYNLEDRWIRDMGYDQIVPAAVGKALENAKISADAIDHFVMPAIQRGVTAREAKRSGIKAEAVRDTLAASVGETGTAHAILMLAHALEEAEPGQKIMVVGFGQGADVLIFETTEALKKFNPQSGVSGHLARGTDDDNYTRFLSFNGLLDYEWGIRAERDNRTAQSTFYRKREAVTAFMGGRCAQCGTVQFPKSKVCVNPNCQAVDTQEDYPFADMGAAIKTFTEDNLAYSPNPPLQYGNVAFEEGGNVFMDMTDFDAGSISVGQQVKMVFRIKDFDDKRGFRRYFWKAAPAS